MTSRLTPEEAQERRRARDRLKKARKRAPLKAERAKTSARGSKTSAAYRMIRFGRPPEMTKAEMRAVIAQAVRNTQAMVSR